MPTSRIKPTEILLHKSGFRTAGFLLCAALLLGVLAVRLVPGAVWITDNGNKYIQMRNLAAHGTRAIAHPMPECFPCGGFHFQKSGEKIYSFYPEYLAFLTVPFYRMFGDRGILFWPIFATLALLGSFRLFFGRRGPGWLLLAATPLLFYSLVFWEMTPSVLFAFLGVALLLRKRYALGGLLFGCGLWMREELYFLVFAAVLALWLCRERRGAWLAVVGFLCGGAPIWCYQFLTSGHVLGLHGALYHLNNRTGFSLLSELSGTVWNYWHHLFRFEVYRNQNLWLWLIPGVSLLAAGAAPRFRAWRMFKQGAAWLFGATELYLFIELCRHPSPAFAAGSTVGLIAATPVLAGFFLNWRPLLRSRNRTTRLLTVAAVLYILTVPPLLTRADVGLVWGARHFLVLLPFLLVLSFRGALLSGLSRPLCALLAALGIAIQGYGFYALDRVSRASREVEEKLLAAPEPVVVTDVFFLPEQTPRLFFGKTVLEAASPEGVTRLVQSDVRRFTLVLSPKFRRLADPELKRLLEAFPPVSPPERHPDSGAGFLELLTVRCARPGQARSTSTSSSSPRMTYPGR